MRVAIPEINGNVSPRFGTSWQINIFTFERNKLINREIVDVKDRSPFEKARTVKEQKVNILLCVGIEGWIYHYLSGFGIRVQHIPPGPINLIVNKFISGNLELYSMQEPYFPVIKGRFRKRYRGFKNKF